jgi:hypothetical protein
MLVSALAWLLAPAHIVVNLGETSVSKRRSDRPLRDAPTDASLLYINLFPTQPINGVTNQWCQWPMDPSESNIHSFIIKIWLEETAKEAGRAWWRGHIAQALSGKRRYLYDLDDIAVFIAPLSQRNGGKVKSEVAIATMAEAVIVVSNETERTVDN